MINRESRRIVDAIAGLEGSIIASEAHESVRFEYQYAKTGVKETWELDLAEKLATEFNGESCYYVPAFRVDENGSKSTLSKIVLIPSYAKIVAGESIDYFAIMSPRKDKLTETVWEENKREIRKRRGAIGGVAVGSSALAAGIVVGTIGIKKWVEKRR